MSTVQVFVSFDTQHDEDLFDLLVAQSQTASSGFEVLGGSKRSTRMTVESESARRRIREADQMIIICGEHTQTSTRVSHELELAQQERTPYILLWGRRDSMCQKPTGAKPAEGMYSWTRQILQDQIALTSRKAAADASAEEVRDTYGKR